MDKDLVSKVIDDENFLVHTLAELFAYEVVTQALEIGLDGMDIDKVYNSVHIEFNHQNYKEEIYDEAKKILLIKYNINLFSQ